jgi:hypothetical protein
MLPILEIGPFGQFVHVNISVMRSRITVLLYSLYVIKNYPVDEPNSGSLYKFGSYVFSREEHNIWT